MSSNFYDEACFHCYKKASRPKRWQTPAARHEAQGQAVRSKDAIGSQCVVIRSISNVTSSSHENMCSHGCWSSSCLVFCAREVSALQDKGDTSSNHRGLLVSCGNMPNDTHSVSVEHPWCSESMLARTALSNPSTQNRFDTSSKTERQQQAGGTSRRQDARLHQSGDGRCQATRCGSVGERSEAGRTSHF